MTVNIRVEQFDQVQAIFSLGSEEKSNLLFLASNYRGNYNMKGKSSELEAK